MCVADVWMQTHTPRASTASNFALEHSIPMHDARLTSLTFRAAGCTLLCSLLVRFCPSLHAQEVSYEWNSPKEANSAVGYGPWAHVGTLGVPS